MRTTITIIAAGAATILAASAVAAVAITATATTRPNPRGAAHYYGGIPASA